MTFNDEEQALAREELARMPGPVVVEFGASWCGFCRSFAPQFARLLQEFDGVTHIKVEDGRGKPLGRSFRVTLWPTFVFQRDGKVLDKLVRPGVDEVREAFGRLTEENLTEA